MHFKNSYLSKSRIILHKLFLNSLCLQCVSELFPSWYLQPYLLIAFQHVYSKMFTLFSLDNTFCCYFQPCCHEHEYTHLCVTVGSSQVSGIEYMIVLGLQHWWAGSMDKIIFIFLLYGGSYTKDFIFLNAHRRFWKCRSHLN